MHFNVLCVAKCFIVLKTVIVNALYIHTIKYIMVAILSCKTQQLRYLRVIGNKNILEQATLPAALA